MDRKIAELNKKPSEDGRLRGRHYVLAGSHRPYSQAVPAGCCATANLTRGIDIANHPTIPIYGQKIVAAADGKVLDGVYRQHRRRQATGIM